MEEKKIFFYFLDNFECLDIQTLHLFTFNFLLEIIFLINDSGKTLLNKIFS